MHGDVPTTIGVFEGGDRGIVVVKAFGQDIGNAPRRGLVDQRQPCTGYPGLFPRFFHSLVHVVKDGLSTASQLTCAHPDHDISTA
jgi:hypothetical protein